MDRRPKAWRLKTHGYWDPGYATWDERHGGWSKREAAHLAEPIDETDPFPPREAEAMGRADLHPLEMGYRE